MKAIALTDRGMVRPNNEDTVYCSVQQVGELPNLFVVADGMGGANAGEYASGFVIKELVKQITETKRTKEHTAVMRRAIETANALLFKESGKTPEHRGCGTTLVTAMIDQDTLYVANVGDSRLYLIDDGIKQITKDHSYVEEMVECGRMVRGSQDYISNKNIITRAIGVDKNVSIDFFEISIKGDETILLCTDGLSNMLDDETIKNIIKSADTIEQAGQRLIGAANEHGGVDNVSVVLITGLKE